MVHAPEWQCRALYDLDPTRRFCWIGAPRAYEGELNPGCFGLIHLLDSKALGKRLDIVAWDHVESRGDIFSRNGKPGVKDWRGLVPFLELRFTGEHHGWDAYDVFSGAFVRRQRQRMAPQWTFDLEAYENLHQQGRDYETVIDHQATKLASHFEHETRFSPDYDLTTREERIASTPEHFGAGKKRFDHLYTNKYGSHLRITPDAK
jgi:hypothetical protein